MKFSRLQISFMLLLFTGISNHVMILPQLLKVAGRDAWICVFVAYVLLVGWAVIIYITFLKLKGEGLINWVHNRAGKYVSKCIAVIFSVYFLVSGMLSSYDFVIMTKVYFLPYTPAWLITACFFILCIWAAFKGFKVIVYMSAVLLPIVWLLGMFVASSTMAKKDYSLITPVLINGYEPVFNGAVIVLGGSVDILILLLIQKRMEKPFRFFHLVILITILLGLVFGPATGAIASFGTNAAENFRFPAFEQWRLVQLGKQVSHLDFLAVFQFLSGSLIKVSLCLYFLTDLFEVKSQKNKRNLLIAAGILMSVISMVPIGDIWIQNIIAKAYYPVLLISGIALSLILFTIGYLPKKEKGRANHV
ncbi:GerAB/ArcD/ProY family transporter [Lysinibacillus sphaericus]